MTNRRAFIAGQNRAMKFFDDDHKYSGLSGFDALKKFIDYYNSLDVSSKWGMNYIIGLEDVLDMWDAIAISKAKHQILANKGITHDDPNFTVEYRALDGFVVPLKVHYDAAKYEVQYCILRAR